MTRVEVDFRIMTYLSKRKVYIKEYCAIMHNVVHMYLPTRAVRFSSTMIVFCARMPCLLAK